jgi:ATP-dependent DNA helicase RecG
MPEQQNIEYKQSWHDDYLKWICGFANAIGGIIYIGKDNNGDVVHLKNYNKLLEDIPNKIRNSLGIICDVQLHDQDGKKYISIIVHPYSVAVSLRGRYYYRSGSVKSELTGIELNDFLLKKSGKTWDDVIEEGASIDDISEASIAKFIQDSKEKARMPDTEGLTVFQILEKLQLTENDKLKRAAIILFGKDPGRFYPNIQVKIGRFGKDSTDLKFHEIVEGNLVQMLDEVQKQLNYKFLTRPVDFVGMQRVEKDEYPVAALREMLLNALVHRNYMGSDIQLRVYDNNLSIWNEGGLPFGLTIEELKGEHNSRPRNPKIAKACFMAGYIDTWGRGTLRIYNSSKEHGLPEPDIKEKDGGFIVTLFKALQASADGSAIGGTIGGAIGGTIGGVIDGVMGGVIDDLTERQIEVLRLLQEDKKLSIRKLADKLNIHVSAAQSHIDALKEKKVIKREGGTRGKWVILIEL